MLPFGVFLALRGSYSRQCRVWRGRTNRCDAGIAAPPLVWLHTTLKIV